MIIAGLTQQGHATRHGTEVEAVAWMEDKIGEISEYHRDGCLEYDNKAILLERHQSITVLIVI